jgi:hypothetical protein
VSARLLDVTVDEYHADPCVTPSLSASIANLLLAKSPKHAWQAHPRLGGIRRESTRAMDAGTMIHKLVLGEGVDFHIIDRDDYRTKHAQEMREAAREAGLLPVLKREFETARTAADAIVANLRPFGFRFDGESEVAIEWTENGVAGPVLCRGMFDHVHLDRGVILDLKKSRSAHPSACENHVAQYGYDLQSVAYRRALEHLRPSLAGRTDFVFLFVEMDPPHAVTPARLTGLFRELGERKWAEAVDTWSVCLRDDEWPAYTRKVLDLEAPRWAVARSIEEAAE